MEIMEESLFSPSWYRIAKLKPRLRSHAHIHRHTYSGELWYVLQDHATGQFYRFTPVVFYVVGMMDGSRTIQELWDKALQHFGDNAPTQGDIVRLLGQLHASNVLQCDITPDTEELFRRFKKTEQTKLKMNLRTPLALRFPLFDPEKILRRFIGFVRPVFSIPGIILWATIVVTAVVLAAQHWAELNENFMDRVLSTQNLFLIWLIYPFIKALHEFGHAFAVKRWGGEVHEMGIMLLVLMPIPYVDASSASALREKWRRVVVGAAGMLVELFVAALALFLWLSIDHGVVRSVAYNIMLVAGVSTLLFNGNPLLRYDGYYILSDLLEIPNLAQRSINYLGYLIKRYMFGLNENNPPYVGQGERFWLIFYSIASFIYRIFIYAAIIMFIAGKFFTIGILLGIWAFLSMVIIPVFKGIHFVLFDPALYDRRTRAVIVSGALIIGIVISLFFMPFPSWTRAEGVIWVPEESLVRAGSSGFIERLKAIPNSFVKRGDTLIHCRDPLLEANVKVLKAQLKALEAQYTSAFYESRVRAKMIKEEIAHTKAALLRAEKRFADLTILSQSDGMFIIPNAEDLPGRYVNQGELVAYVVDIDRPTVRVVVPQSAVDLIRNLNNGVEVRLAERIEKTACAVIKREVPSAGKQLPSMVLGSIGGGEIATDPRDARGLKAMEKIFQFDLELTSPVDSVYVGGRVYVRFDHGLEPLAIQWYRDLRRLFLRRFNV